MHTQAARKFPLKFPHNKSDISCNTLRARHCPFTTVRSTFCTSTPHARCMWVISRWRNPINAKRVAICQRRVLGPQLPIPQFQLNLTPTSGEIPGIFAVARMPPRLVRNDLGRHYGIAMPGTSGQCIVTWTSYMVIPGRSRRRRICNGKTKR